MATFLGCCEGLSELCRPELLVFLTSFIYDINIWEDCNSDIRPLMRTDRLFVCCTSSSSLCSIQLLLWRPRLSIKGSQWCLNLPVKFNMSDLMAFTYKLTILFFQILSKLEWWVGLLSSNPIMFLTKSTASCGIVAPTLLQNQSEAKKPSMATSQVF